jgi:uncharacterized protein YjiS (DUF1127 family)
MAQFVSNLSSGAGLRRVRRSYLQEGLVGLFNLGQAWMERRRTRQRLYQMPDYMLHDIGISRAEVEREFTKPFWKD